MRLSIFKIILQGAIHAEAAGIRRCYLFLITKIQSHFSLLPFGTQSQEEVAEIYPYEMGNPFKKLCRQLPLF